MHEKYMNIAIKEAKKAFKNNDVPVGCIIVKNNKIISKAYNKVKLIKNCLFSIFAGYSCQIIFVFIYNRLIIIENWTSSIAGTCPFASISGWVSLINGSE